jgi:DNA topoisomerase-6 subunit A
MATKKTAKKAAPPPAKKTAAKESPVKAAPAKKPAAPVKAPAKAPAKPAKAAPAKKSAAAPAKAIAKPQAAPAKKVVAAPVKAPAKAAPAPAKKAVAAPVTAPAKVAAKAAPVQSAQVPAKKAEVAAAPKKAAPKAAPVEAPSPVRVAPKGSAKGIDALTMGKIEHMASRVLTQVDSSGQPFLTMKHRSLSNVAYNEKRGIIELGDKTLTREFFNINMAKKFMQSFLVANGVKTLIEEGKTISIRQMFYMSKHTIKGTQENTFDDQSESDPIIEDLEVTVDALREELHLFANRRGLVVGRLVVNDAGDEIDLTRMGRGGWGIPSICEEDSLKFVRTNAKFILLVEKQAIFHRLNEDRFWEKNDCILLTSEGQAARGARRLLQRMATELKLPIYVLVDNDPWGLYIYSVLKQGSINLAFESMRLAVPNVRFLGMSSFDYDKFKLTPAATIKLSKEDITRAEQMRAYPWFKEKRWQREIDKLLSNGFKMEVDALLTKSISFITEEYIPRKLRENDWIV